ncbi:MAG: thiamine pyrophosphate-binding protein [Candidatus Hatepunaea meridiana]|nr:thiamine pyrophosphate-binding protein [Candidatus Hatepunaea meridiana]
MKSSDLFLKALEEEGVDYIFGVPGEENADLMMSLLDSPIKFILAGILTLGLPIPTVKIKS